MVCEYNYLKYLDNIEGRQLFKTPIQWKWT